MLGKLLNKVLSMFNKLKGWQKMLVGFVVGYLIHKMFVVENFETDKPGLFTMAAGLMGIKTPEALLLERKKKAEEDGYSKYQGESEEVLEVDVLMKLGEADEYMKYD